jgi:hypothetical protein
MWKKKLLIPMFLIFNLLLTSCDGESQGETKQVNKTSNESNEKTSVIDKLPDFPISLNSFVDNYNANENGLENLTLVTDPSELEFEVFNENQGFMKKLINEDKGDVQYDLLAIFDTNKKFKRLVFGVTAPNGATSESISVIINTFYALGIDPNYLNDFLDSDESSMEFTDNGYKVNLMFEPSIGFLNATIDKDEQD